MVGLSVARAVGLVLVCVSYARDVGLVYLVCLPVGICLFCIGLMPLSYVYRGGAVHFFVFSSGLGLVFFLVVVGLCHFWVLV